MMDARRALVTGGTRGIGRAIALTLTRAGYDVAVVSRRQDAVDAALRDRVAAHGMALDVRDHEALSAYATDGRYDTLVNNAGGASTAPFLKTDISAFRTMFALNVESAIVATQACLPAMIERGFGRVINISSTAGLRGYGYVSAYVAAKHALLGVTRSLALEVARRGVTVNAVCPGYTDTDLVSTSIAEIVAKTGRSERDAQSHFTASNPMGRLVRPEEVADTVLWLAGAGASAVTGQSVAVAGGEL